MGLQERTLGMSPPPPDALLGKLGLRESGAKGDRKRKGSRQTGGSMTPLWVAEFFSPG